MSRKDMYKEPRVCDCGYVTVFSSAWSAHKMRCKLVTTSKDARIASLEKQLADQKEQLAAKDEQIKELMKKLIEVHTPPPVRSGAAKGTKRKKMTEPKRRKIAARQEWKCANPDGNCTLKGDLQEYDVDHITPLLKGGPDNESNMQALCPACHRRKTENENVEMCTVQTLLSPAGSPPGHPLL